MGDEFFWGKRGGTKTCRAMINMWLDWLVGSEMWANTWLHPAFDRNTKTNERGNYKYIDAVDLIKLLLNDALSTNMKPKTLLLDEMKSQASARDFTSFINKHLTNFVSQARKRNFTILYTDQILGAYDRWIRLMTERVTRCIPKFDYNDLGLGTLQYPEPISAQYVEISLIEDDLDTEPNVYTLQRATLRNFYPLYKTERIVTPVELKYSNEEIGELTPNAV